jgi:hypothetical protein
MAALAWTSTEEELAVFTVHLLLALHLQICRMSDNLKTRNSVLCLSCLPIKHEGTTDISDPPGQMVVPSSYLRSTSTDGRPRRRGRLLRRVQLVQDTIAIGNHLDW